MPSADPAPATPFAGSAAPASLAPLPLGDLRDIASSPQHRRRVTVPAGGFWMGSEDRSYPEDREGPPRFVEVAPFAIDAYAVCNARYAAFVLETGYRSDAERLGGSFVFAPDLHAGLRSTSAEVPGLPWWRYVLGACWHSPEGPGSTLEGRQEHPVVHLSWRDAAALATWSGGRLPREAEWEYAAGGGVNSVEAGHPFPWGDELEQNGEQRCNVFQGSFPERDSALDAYRGTAPVGAYAANGYGLHQVIGNVWEWCADPFVGRASERVKKGGSFLCHHSYCRRYRLAARTSGREDDTAGNLGVRLVYPAA